MSQVTITEDEFSAVASAAVEAQRQGDDATAKVLDKLARKMNATLSSGYVTGVTPMRLTGKPRWQDMPSVLDPA